MAKVLTELAVRNAKPRRHNGESVLTEIADGGCRGLRLVLHPTGHRSWIVRYRYGSRTRKLTLGAAIVVSPSEPDPPHGLTLANARKHATDALHKLAQGTDPGEEKQRTQPTTPAMTFAAVAAECFNREAKRAKPLRSAMRQLHDLERLVFPAIGKLPIAAVRRGDVIRLLDHIEDAHGPVMADFVLSSVRKAMNWWAIRDENYAVPLVRGMRRSNSGERARERILSDAELRLVWAAASKTEGPAGSLIHFLVLTGCRLREAADMRRTELVDNIWALPATRAKTKKAVVRPLSKAAMDVLARVTPQIAGSDLVFTFDGKRPISSFGKIKHRLDELSGVTGWTLHDLRRTARSLLSRAGVDSNVAERCLGHAIGGVRGTYDRHKYEREMLDAYEKLATQIDLILNPRDNVTALRVRG